MNAFFISIGIVAVGVIANVIFKYFARRRALRQWCEQDKKDSYGMYT